MNSMASVSCCLIKVPLRSYCMFGSSKLPQWKPFLYEEEDRGPHASTIGPERPGCEMWEPFVFRISLFIALK